MSTPPREDTPVEQSLEARLAAIPRVDALGADRPALAAWFAAWTGRHTLVAALAIPVLYWFYAGALGTLVPDNGLVLASLVVAAVLGGLVVATYVPTAGSKASPTTCAASALIPLVIAYLLFQGAATSPATAVVAAVLVALGLVQRVFGAGACAA
jgi:hypothetical protein